MKHVEVGGMCEAAYGLRTFEQLRDEELGRYAVLFRGPWSMDQLREAVAFCKQHNVRFVMDEMWQRTQPAPAPGYADMDPQAFRTLMDAAGACRDGTLFMCEYGGVAAYWPVSTVEGSPNVIPPTSCAAEARDRMVGKLRELIEAATSWMVPRPLILIEASPMAKYLYEAGIDRVDLEVTYNRFTELGYAATRGAARAYGRERFGTDMAMVWYGGNQHDPLWRHRWKVSLYQAFLRGADPIYAEHGVMDYEAHGKSRAADDPEVRMFRRELAAFADFCRRHPRPDGFPKTGLAVIHGNLDSFAENTIGQPYVWGQRGADGMRAGYPEQSWELFLSLYRNRPWAFPFASGDRDPSGNPPWGQVDAIPAESDLSTWRQYDAVMFLGWNTMTPEIYAVMKAFVAGGGHVLASLAHLDGRTRRTGAVEPVHDGDLHELFGVRVRGLDGRIPVGIRYRQQPSRGAYGFPAWSEEGDPLHQHGGFPAATLELTSAELIAAGSDRFTDTWTEMDRAPVLTANAHGEGMAFLLNALDYPGHPGLRELYGDLLYYFAAAWQGDLQVEAGDRVRYGVFTEGEMHILYALNCDPVLEQQIRVSFGRHDRVPFTIGPGRLTAVYLTPHLLACRRDVTHRVTGMDLRGDTLDLRFYAQAPDGCDVTYRVDGRPWQGQVRLTTR